MIDGTRRIRTELAVEMPCGLAAHAGELWYGHCAEDQTEIMKRSVDGSTTSTMILPLNALST